MRVLAHVVLKEILQLRRDRRMIPAMILGPLVQLLALGFAANLDVTRIPLLVLDQDHSRESRDLVDRLVASSRFTLAAGVEREAEIEPHFIAGTAQAALVIAAGYGEEIGRNGRPRVQWIVDGSDSTSAVVGLGYASSIVTGLAGEHVRLRLERLGLSPPRVVLEPRVFYNPDLKSRWFYVPSILALTLMLLTMILPSMAVVREREIGTMEQIIVTPVRSWQLILGKLLPFAVVGVIDLLLVTALARAVFGVPLVGSVGVLIILTLPFLVTMLGLGLLASTLVRTQQQAMMSSVFLLMVPMIYLSGLIFPIENMPTPIQYATLAIPLRYYNHVIRGVFLKGSGFDALWQEGLILCGFAFVTILAAALRFRKSLD